MQIAAGTCPSVERPAHAAYARGAVCQRQSWRCENPFRCEHIFGRLRVNACVEVHALVVRHVQAYLEVSAPAECYANHASTVLLRCSVEGKHHFGRIKMRVACSISVPDGFQSACQRLVGNDSLGSPVAVQMSEPDIISLADMQVSAIEALEGDRLLLAVLDLRPCLYYIHVAPGFVEHPNSHGLQFVLERDTQLLVVGLITDG